MRSTRNRCLAVLAATALVVVAACTSSPSPSPTSTSSVPAPRTSSGDRPTSTSTPVSGVQRVLLSALDGATVPAAFTLVDDTPGVSEAKFYLTSSGRTFLAAATSAPFETPVSLPAGPNELEVRHVVAGDRSRVDVRFTVSTGSTGPTSPTTTAPAPSGSPFTTPAPTTTVSTPAALAAALAAARPGTVIRVADGDYLNAKGDRWHLAANGTADRPITLEGGRGAVLRSDSTSGDYGVWITGSYWRVTGISVRTATKGIVLDGSQHSVVDNVDVSDTGEEGVHFRTCSSDGVLQNSTIRDTGREKPQFGEGVYVGSARSNWGKYGCADGQDKSERTVIRGNRFTHVAAEGADLKEGTSSGSLIDNTFTDTGYSGKNSADSAVDVKGRGWTIRGNTVGAPTGAAQDAFQTHALYPGYGTDNVFTDNVVLGRWPGFGIGLYPRAANVVRCDNVATGALRGLLGAADQRLGCLR